MLLSKVSHLREKKSPLLQSVDSRSLRVQTVSLFFVPTQEKAGLFLRMFCPT